MKTRIAVLGACALSPLACAQVGTSTFDAARGTLPSYQGFERLAGRDPGVARVQSGELLMGPTVDYDVDYWQQINDFSFDDGLLINATLMVKSSTYRTDACGGEQRPGYYLGASDSRGRMIYLGISSDRVFIMNSIASPVGPETPTVLLPLANQWHTYELKIQSCGVSLSIDGNHALDADLGPTGQSWGKGKFLFGDGTFCGWSQSVMKAVSYTVGLPDCPADFNGDCWVDGADYDAFVMCFDEQLCPQGKTADFNGDGFADGFDYDDFVWAFEQGCNGQGSGGNGGGSGDGSGGGTGGGSGGGGGSESGNGDGSSGGGEGENGGGTSEGGSESGTEGGSTANG